MSSETTSVIPLLTTMVSPLTTTAAPVVTTAAYPAEEVPEINTYKLGFDKKTHYLAIAWIVLVVVSILNWFVFHKISKYLSILLIIAYFVIWIILIVLHKKQEKQNEDDNAHYKCDNFYQAPNRFPKETKLMCDSIESKKTNAFPIGFFGFFAILALVGMTSGIQYKKFKVRKFKKRMVVDTRLSLQNTI